MADEADIANDYITNAISSALNNRQQNMKAHVITKTCKECDEPIPAERRKMGFQYCIECAAEIERRESLFADY